MSCQLEFAPSSRLLFCLNWRLICLIIVALCNQQISADAEATVEVVLPGHALVIGVQDYEHVPSLRFARRDAEAVSKLFTECSPPLNKVSLMTGRANQVPTASNIRSRLEELAKVEHGKVLVYFSGHAACRDDEELCLVPADGSSENQESWIALGEVFDALSRSQARLKLVIVDAVNASTPALQPPNGISLLMAAEPNSPAFESPRWKHGVFTHYLLQALRGAADYDHNGLVTLPEVELYTKQRVSRAAMAEFNRPQMPWLVGGTYGLPTIMSLDWAESSTK